MFFGVGSVGMDYPTSNHAANSPVSSVLGKVPVTGEKKRGYRTTRVTAATSATNRPSALGPRNTWSTALGAWLAIAALRIGRLRYRYAKSQRQKSARSHDRRIALQAQRTSEKSKKMIVSAARSRTSTTSEGPRSPSIIHPSSAI